MKDQRPADAFERALARFRLRERRRDLLAWALALLAGAVLVRLAVSFFS